MKLTAVWFWHDFNAGFNYEEIGIFLDYIFLAYYMFSSSIFFPRPDKVMYEKSDPKKHQGEAKLI